MTIHELRTAVLTLLFVACTITTTTSAQCPQPDASDQEPDTEALQCLLDQGGTITLDADTQYA